MIKSLKPALEYYEKGVRQYLNLKILQKLRLEVGRQTSVKLSRYRYALWVIERTLQITKKEKSRIRAKVFDAICPKKS